MEKIKFRITNTAGDYLKSVSPLAWTANITEAMTKETDTDSVDYSWIASNVLNTIEKILSFSAGTVALSLLFFSETDNLLYKISLTPTTKGLTVEGLVPSGTTLSTEMRDAVTTISENVINEIQDIYLRSLSSKTLAGAVEEMKEALGMKSPEFSKIDDISKLIDSISKNTKAEILKPKETLKDYVADTYLMDELYEIVDFINNDAAYKKVSVDIPKGILFKGPAGTGKTYAAKCIAGTADCYFMLCTASALQGMYIGSGADNLRNLFKGAKLLAEKSKKWVIIFMDEFDSFGSRENHGGGAGGEEDRTSNQLLAEMTNIDDPDINVMVMAATNFPEKLDFALQRSGRFGRQITIDYPDEIERRKLIDYYFSKKGLHLDSSVTIDDIVELTKNMTPADIKEISNESCILTIRAKQTEIKLDAINEAIDRVLTKSIKRPDPKDPKEKILVSAHESGHTLAEVYYCKSIPTKVENIPRGDGSGGFTQSGSTLRGMASKERFLNEIRILVAGRAAEEVICGYITTGASSDYDRARRLIKDYFKVYNFEPYKAAELDQIILDKLHSIYDEVVKDFKSDKLNKILKDLTDELLSKRVLTSSDIVALTSTLGGIKIW